MTDVSIWIALAAFFGTTFAIIAYFRKEGTSLEERVNNIVKDKKKIVSEGYENLLERIFEAYKTQRKLSDEHKEELEKIADLSERLDRLPYDLSEVVDKLTYSFLSGALSAVLILLFAYLPSAGFDEITLPWTQLLVLISATVFAYRYLTDSFLKIHPLRKFEKLINAIDRCETFKSLHELAQD